ncbi:MAG: GNAT family N-acetyltransferase [Candidatus Sericytochromatia bacterium]
MFTDIDTERCRIRLFREADLHAFSAYRAEPEVTRFQSWSSYSYEDAVALYKDVTGKTFGLEGHWYQLAIADGATDALIGDLALHFVGPGIGEIGFTISPEYQGQGYGKEGVLGLLAYLFDVLGFTKVIAVTDVMNGPAIGVLESMGFERKADARSVMFKGEPGKEYDYSFTREKWLLRNQS